MPDVYILQTTHHGDNQQLKALADQLPATRSARMERIRLRFRSRKYTRFYAVAERVLRRNNLAFRIQKLIRRLLLRGPVLNLRAGDFLFVKTPPCEWPASLLVAGQQATAVFLGEPQRVSRDTFCYCISTPSTPCTAAEIQLEVMPTLMLRALRNDRRRALLDEGEAATDKPHWCLLFGGNTHGYAFTQQRLETLLDAIVSMARQHNILWVLSTSPRTTRAFEVSLSRLQLKHPDLFHQLCLWHSGTRVPLLDLLATADLCFVSEESVAMLSDALNVGLPVVSFRPELSRPAIPVITPFLDYHENRQRLHRISIQELSDFSLADVKCLASVEECWSTTLHQQVEWRAQAKHAIIKETEGREGEGM